MILRLECYCHVETWHGIESALGIARAGENSFECRATLGETSGESVIDFDEYLSRSYDVSDPAAPPPRVLIKTADLLNLLYRSALGDLKLTPGIPTKLAQVGFLIGCRPLKYSLIQFELGLGEAQVEGNGAIRVGFANLRRQVFSNAGSDPESADHTERPSHSPIEVVHPVDRLRIRTHDAIEQGLDFVRRDYRARGHDHEPGQRLDDFA